MPIAHDLLFRWTWIVIGVRPRRGREFSTQLSETTAPVGSDSTRIACVVPWATVAQRTEARRATARRPARANLERRRARGAGERREGEEGNGTAGETGVWTIRKRPCV